MSWDDFQDVSPYYSEEDDFSSDLSDQESDSDQQESDSEEDESAEEEESEQEELLSLSSSSSRSASPLRQKSKPKKSKPTHSRSRSSSPHSPRSPKQHFAQLDKAKLQLRDIQWRSPFQLKQVQKDALHFAAAKSALIAAEMGVGKTLIGIHWFIHQLQNAASTPALILVPKAVLSYWGQEIAKHTSLQPAQIKIINTRAQLTSLVKWNPDRKKWMLIPGPACYLMTHNLYASLVVSKRTADSFWNNKRDKLDQARIDRALGSQKNALGTLAGFISTHWHCFVVDEAHAARNTATDLWQALNWSSRQHLLLLTGTPIVNGRQDLEALAQLLDSRYDSHWWDRHADNADRLEQWRKQFLFYAPSDLPLLPIHTATFNLNKKEERSYNRYYKHLSREVRHYDGSNMAHILATLQKVRIAVNHSALPHADKAAKRPFRKSSSKIECLLEQLAQMPGKTVIFSQWSSFLRGLQPLLPSAALLYTGDLTSKQRSSVLEQFEQDASIRYLLVTYAAGGVGLNLQATAQNVVLCDPWWNSATEQQAVARVHRFGQEKPVRVVRLEGRTVGGDYSIEQWLEHIKSRKQDIAQTYVGVDLGGVKLEAANANSSALNLTQLQNFLSWTSQHS